VPQTKTAAEVEATHHALVSGAKENISGSPASAAAATQQSPSKVAYRELLGTETGTGTSCGTKILRFSSTAPVKPQQ
jgi:hypothetical protein